MSATLFHMIDGAPAPVAPFSHAVESDGWVLLTGQMPTDPAAPDAPLPEGIEAQTRRVIDNLAIVLAVAMDRDSARRYATAAALADDLERVQQRQPISAKPPGPWLRTRRWCQRNPYVAAALTILVVGLFSVSWLLVERGRTIADRDAAQSQRDVELLSREVMDLLGDNPGQALEKAYAAWEAAPMRPVYRMTMSF